MSGEAFDVDDEVDEVIPEEWPTVYTPVPVWVLLAVCSAQAFRMYAFLAEHINTSVSAKRIAFPSQRAIARAMGLKDYRDVAKYREELDALGAIRFEEFRYAGGMRRRYRYWVRFNPPKGYVGPVSLSEFYEANPDVHARRSQSARSAAMQETAGQHGGGKNPTTGGGEEPTSHSGKSPTAQQRHQVDADQTHRAAPSQARSALEARRAPTGSSVRARGGSAASGKKRSRLSRAEYEAVKAVRALLPPDLEKALPVKTPPNVAAAVVAALGAGTPLERTPEQLVAHRVVRRWDGYWASRFYAGDLSKGPKKVPSVVGPFLAMLKAQQECGSLTCEDRHDFVLGQPCQACEMRTADKRANHGGAKEHPAVETPVPKLPQQTTVPWQDCAGCERPYRAAKPGRCSDCPVDAVGAHQSAAAPF